MALFFPAPVTGFIFTPLPFPTLGSIQLLLPFGAASYFTAPPSCQVPNYCWLDQLSLTSEWPVDSMSDCDPNGQGSNPNGDNFCEAIFGVLCLFVTAGLVRRLNNSLSLTHLNIKKASPFSHIALFNF